MSRGSNVTGAISRLFLAVISCFHALPHALGGYAFTVHSLIFTAFESVIGSCTSLYYVLPSIPGLLSYFCSHSRGYGQFKASPVGTRVTDSEGLTSAGPGPNTECKDTHYS